MNGDPNAIVVDVWIARAFKQDRKYLRRNNGRPLERSSGIAGGTYTTIEKYITDEALRIGWQPRELCAAIWAGVRYYHTGSRQTSYVEFLNHHFNNLFNII